MSHDKETMTMPNQTFGSLIAGWRKLLAAALAHEPELPQIGPFAAALEEALEDLIAAKARQQSLQAKCVQATEEVNDELACARDAVARLKSFVRALWGRKDERLAAFGVKPRSRPRTGRAAEGKGGSPGYTH